MKQTIYFGGEILTMERELYAEAVLVEDGVIRAVGLLSELKALAPDARMANLRGAALLPAFIDSHSHITAYAQTLGLLSLEGCRSFDEMAARLRRFREERGLGEGEWITAFGYDHNDLAEGRHPTRELLDRACPGNPVLVSHASGHMGVANSAALAAMGIGREARDPEGGRIGREADGQTPSGYLEETAFTGGSSAIPQPTLEQRLRQLEQAQRDYLSYGIATVQDGLTREPEWELLRTLAESGRLELDVVSYVDMKRCPQLLTGAPDYARYRGRLRVGGYKIFLDGSPQGRTAWMSEPYLDAPDGFRGYPAYGDEEVRRFLREALLQQKQILVHCNGDAAAQQLIDCYGAARAELDAPADIRPVMIHAQLVRPDQLERMAKLRMIASFFVAHTWYWGDVHLKNFGRERAGRISPARSAIERGVAYTFHQDTPVVPPDMLHTLWCAVNRRTKEGVELGPGERISTLEALRGVTVNAAYQYFEEGGKGSIRAGKRADLVILDRDPLRVDPMELRDLRVLATIKDGDCLYRRD